MGSTWPCSWSSSIGTTSRRPSSTASTRTLPRTDSRTGRAGRTGAACPPTPIRTRWCLWRAWAPATWTPGSGPGMARTDGKGDSFLSVYLYAENVSEMVVFFYSTVHCSIFSDPGPDPNFHLVSDPDPVSDPTWIFSNILNINFSYVFPSCKCVKLQLTSYSFLVKFFCDPRILYF